MHASLSVLFIKVLHTMHMPSVITYPTSLTQATAFHSSHDLLKVPLVSMLEGLQPCNMRSNLAVKYEGGLWKGLHLSLLASSSSCCSCCRRASDFCSSACSCLAWLSATLASSTDCVLRRFSSSNCKQCTHFSYSQCNSDLMARLAYSMHH